MAYLAKYPPITKYLWSKDQSDIEGAVSRSGRSPGFDALRIYLALAIYLYHTWVVRSGMEGHAEFAKGSAGPVITIILPIFFALSGFLVAGSMDRVRSLATFLLHRVIRIYPALAIVVLFTALVIGPFVTTLPLSDYFSSPQLRDYFWTVTGRVRYPLPGVFVGNPDSYPNRPMWTIPFELESYIAFSALVVFGIFHRRYWLLGLYAIVLGFFAYAEVQKLYVPMHDWILDGRMLVLAFLGGVVANRFASEIPINIYLAAVAAALFYVAVRNETLISLSTVLTTYLTVYIGSMKISVPGFFKKNDLSYGIYLFHYPILQSLLFIFPAISWAALLAISTPIVSGIAILSWRLIESPALALKKLRVADFRRGGIFPSKTFG